MIHIIIVVSHYQLIPYMRNKSLNEILTGLVLYIGKYDYDVSNAQNSIQQLD